MFKMNEIIKLQVEISNMQYGNQQLDKRKRTPRTTTFAVLPNLEIPFILERIEKVFGIARKDVIIHLCELKMGNKNTVLVINFTEEVDVIMKLKYNLDELRFRAAIAFDNKEVYSGKMGFPIIKLVHDHDIDRT